VIAAKTLKALYYSNYHINRRYQALTKMQISYRLNANELDNNFLESLKAAFQNKDIETVVYESDETAFLLQNPANRKRLLTAVENIQNRNNLVEVNWDTIS
jgi:antitoxin YefM